MNSLRLPFRVLILVLVGIFLSASDGVHFEDTWETLKDEMFAAIDGISHHDFSLSRTSNVSIFPPSNSCFEGQSLIFSCQKRLVDALKSSVDHLENQAVNLLDRLIPKNRSLCYKASNVSETILTGARDDGMSSHDRDSMLTQVGIKLVECPSLSASIQVMLRFIDFIEVEKSGGGHVRLPLRRSERRSGRKLVQVVKPDRVPREVESAVAKLFQGRVPVGIEWSNMTIKVFKEDYIPLYRLVAVFAQEKNAVSLVWYKVSGKFSQTWETHYLDLTARSNSKLLFLPGSSAYLICDHTV